MLLRNVVSGEYMRSVKNRVKLRLTGLEVEFSERAQASLNQLPVLKLAYLGVLRGICVYGFYPLYEIVCYLLHSFFGRLVECFAPDL